MGPHTHIALLHYSCPPVVGGVEEVMAQQAFLFHRHGHPLRLLAGSGGVFSDRFPIEINPLLGSRHPDVLAAHREIPSGSGPVEAITDRILEFLTGVLPGVDVLIAHNVLTMPYNLPLTRALHRLADSDAVRVIGWCHDSPFFYDSYPDTLTGEAWRILRSGNPNIRYVTICEARRGRFTSLFGEDVQVSVIPNGIDPGEFLVLEPGIESLIREWDLLEADLLLLQPARLHPRKNIPFSIRVVRALRDRGLRARLLLLGSYDPHEDGTISYLKELKDLTADLDLEDDILFLAEYFFRSDGESSLTKALIRDLYLIADLLFLPSLHEGFGLPLLEAGLAKLPIVCSDIAPFLEIGGSDVCTISAQDPPAAVASRLVEFTQSLAPHRMFRRVLGSYRWERIFVEKIHPLLQEVVA
ncbi:MAG: glycosyltransferase family 4 protein [bacterium]|nr:MAG: glycosyltransferase family 4 protein [bacterium]